MKKSILIKAFVILCFMLFLTACGADNAETPIANPSTGVNNTPLPMNEPASTSTPESPAPPITETTPPSVEDETVDEYLTASEEANDFWLYLLSLPDDTCLVTYLSENYGTELLGRRSRNDFTLVRQPDVFFSIIEAEAGRGGDNNAFTFRINAEHWRDTHVQMTNPLFLEIWTPTGNQLVDNEHIFIISASTSTVFGAAAARLDASEVNIDVGRTIMAAIHNLYNNLPIYIGIPGARLHG